MRFSPYANLYSENYLRRIGRVTLSQAKAEPVFAAAFECGIPVKKYCSEGIAIFVSINHDMDSPDVIIEEISRDAIQVTLPNQKYWGFPDEVIEGPTWLMYAANALPDFGSLTSAYESKFTLSQLARVLHRDIPSLMSDLLHAEELDSSMSNKILAASIEKCDPNPEQWLVDMRGYFFSQLVDDLTSPHEGAKE